MLGPPGRERPSKKEEEDTFLLSLFGHHLHPRQQRTAGGRKSWVADCPETGKGSVEPSPQIQKGQGHACLLPVLTKHAPPHSGTHSLADDLAQPPDSLQHTRSPSTAHSEQDPRAGWFAAYQLQALPALPLLQGWVFPAGTSLRSLYSNLWKSVSDAGCSCLLFIYFFSSR